MGIISRFINVVRAYSNSFLDKAEDPEKMLQQMLSDLEGQKRQAKQQMTEALALQKRLERDTEKEHKEAEKWEQKAILAVQNDKDDLAKEALVRKKDHERRAEEFEIQLEKHRANAETLRSGYQAMEDKIESSGAIETLERVEEKVDSMQAKAEAYQEISLDSEKESLEKKFKELEDTPPDIETELLELKKRAALPSPEDNNTSSDK